MEQHARYCVGIDLGNTHSVLSYVDMHAETPQLSVLSIPQMTAPGTVESLPQLGSFIYQPHEHEMSPSAWILPWSDEPQALVGAIARQLASKTPIRLIASAKSWLCHGGVNRRDAFLPAGSPDDVSKLSPLQASELYLEHLQNAWNHQFPQYPLAEQDVTISGLV
jgi:molecular chaperone DnaK (HSP70)